MGSLSVGKGGDGQLTSYKVSGMDLRGTQLVVLSACETGLGAAVEDESESVALLRDGGREDHVTSLWEASSVTAQKMMEAYYRKLAEGMGRGEAMQAVQLEMLRSEEHAHPKDWAAFIVLGDDTPMVFPAGEEWVEESLEPQTVTPRFLHPLLPHRRHKRHIVAPNSGTTPSTPPLRRMTSFDLGSQSPPPPSSTA